MFKFTMFSVFLVALFLVPAAFALGFHQTEPPTTEPPTLDAAWAVFIALIGWPTFLVAAVNLLKLVHVVPDGASGTITYIANAAFFLIVAFLVYSGRLDILSNLDAGLGRVAVLIGNIIVILGGFTGSLAVGKFAYSHVRGYPLVGYSHSSAKAK